MTTESATISTPSTLLEELVERTRLSWPQVAIAVGLVLIMFLGVAVHVDGVRARPFPPYSGSDWWHEVREKVDTPAQIVYVLLAYHFVQRSYYGAIEAFRALGRRLLVVGEGPGRARLAARAPANVEFIGRVPDAVLAELYARCRALVFTAEEDFGIVPVEAQAAGRPVIAYGRGGACESVLPRNGAAVNGATGIWFEPQTPAALAAAVRRFE